MIMDKQQCYALYKNVVGSGWWPILDKYVPQIIEADPNAELYLKEKFGLLRIAMYSKRISSEQQIAWAMAAELESSIICECCGRPGKIRNERLWIMTLCDACHKGTRVDRSAAEEQAEKHWLESSE